MSDAVKVRSEITVIQVELCCRKCGGDMKHVLTEKEAGYRMHRYKCNGCDATHRDSKRYPLLMTPEENAEEIEDENLVAANA